MTADEIIKKLGLEPLQPEGGYYKQTYVSPELIPNESLPSRYITSKPFSTAIYYLLTPNTYSALHKLPTDEIYHFYLGDPVRMLQLYPDGSSKIVILGPDIFDGQQVQVVVPKGVWQGSLLFEGGKFALMGTTMAPGFEFVDYIGGKREDLVRIYPAQKELIEMLTPGNEY